MKQAPIDSLVMRFSGYHQVSSHLLEKAVATFRAFVSEPIAPQSIAPGLHADFVAENDILSATVKNLEAPDAKLIKQVGAPCPSAPELDQASNAFEIASRMDILTGLINRGYSTQRLESDLERAIKTRTPVCLVTIDLDDFTALNERFGASVGDACLKYFADLTQSCVRRDDWVARWGADEFLIVLWDAAIGDVEEVIERLRDKLSHSPEAREAGVSLSATYGSAAYVPGEKAVHVCARAHEALQNAKRKRLQAVATSNGFAS